MPQPGMQEICNSWDPGIRHLTTRSTLGYALGRGHHDRYLDRDLYLAPRCATVLVCQHVVCPQMSGRHGLLIPHTAYRPLSHSFGIFQQVPRCDRASIRRHEQSTLPANDDRLVPDFCDCAELEELFEIILHRHGLSACLRPQHIRIKQRVRTPVTRKRSFPGYHVCSGSWGYIDLR